jgi:hypothetical protein
VFKPVTEDVPKLIKELNVLKEHHSKLLDDLAGDTNEI